VTPRLYEGGKGGTIPRASKTSNKVASTFFNTVHLLLKDLRFARGGAKLASCPGRHLTSLRPSNSLPFWNETRSFYDAPQNFNPLHFEKATSRTQMPSFKRASGITLRATPKFHEMLKKRRRDDWQRSSVRRKEQVWCVLSLDHIGFIPRYPGNYLFKKLCTV